MMENISTYYSELIIKYLSGEITQEEIRVLTKWLQSDPMHQKLFDEFRNTWIAVENSKIDSTVVIDDEWNKLKSRIKESQQSAVSGQHVKSLRRKTGFTSLPLYDYTIGKTSGNAWIIKIAAVLILITIPTFLLFRYFSNPQELSVTAMDQIMETHLPDGTVVSLNRGSTIEYPKHFKGKTREIKLKGEAYFTIRHDEKSKFVIAAGNVRIEDIGTSFYVNTNKADGMMEVVLTEGKASVYFDGNPSGQVVILPGEKVDIRMMENHIEKSINHDVNYLAWKTKRLIFSDNTMSEVVTLLNKVYHSEIRLSGANINNCRLTAIFDNQSLESVLNVIKSTLNVSIISNGSAFEISGNECDL